MSWVACRSCTGEVRNSVHAWYQSRNLNDGTLNEPRHRWEANRKMDSKERVEGCGLIQLVQDDIQSWDLVNMSVPHVVGNFKHLNNYQHLRKYSAL